MARYVKKVAVGPAKFKVKGEIVSVCLCGLTKNPQGRCDDSHLKTEDEDKSKTYVYDEKLNREEAKLCECHHLNQK